MENKKRAVITVDLKIFLIPVAIILAGLIIGAGLFFGLKGKSSTGVKGEGVAQEPGQPSPPPAQGSAANQTAETSLDDDPAMGNKETAQVAIVEFSDYECPFCKRFRDETLDQIKKNYLDTGKAVLVYRDLPLSFHNPAAEREAMAAECAREQGGDAKYFEYHDAIFATSPGNGQGIVSEELIKMAQKLGLAGGQFRDCLESEKFKEEVTADAAEAARIGINGTPGFVVGKLAKDGNVKGVIISGAQPYSAFQSAIEEQLKN